MTTSIHHRLLHDRIPYRIGFMPEPCSWTIVPSAYRRLAHQRARWSQILAEALWIHKTMLFNPRYGGVGLGVLPFYLIFELGSAVVELLAIAVFIAVRLGANIGFRQIYAWWRLRGIIDAIARRKATWLEAPSGTQTIPATAGEPAESAGATACPATERRPVAPGRLPRGDCRAVSSR